MINAIDLLGILAFKVNHVSVAFDGHATALEFINIAFIVSAHTYHCVNISLQITQMSCSPLETQNHGC